MTYTHNFNLNLPEGADQFDVTHWNENTSKIDEVLGKEISDREKAISNISESLNSEIEQRQKDFTDAKNLENATGVLSVSNGGTGKTTLNDALNAMTETSETLDIVNSNDLVLLRRTVNDENKTMNAKMDVLANKIYELLQSKISTTVPLGVIYPFAGEFGTEDEPYKNVPAGYLACDGQEVSRTEYASLFALIGTKYGNGDEINTFNLPDFRNRTLQGASETNAVGKKLEAGLPNINGSFVMNMSNLVNTSKGFSFTKTSNGFPTMPNGNYYADIGIIDFNANNGVATKAKGIYKDDCNTVQAPAQCCNFIIKC